MFVAVATNGDFYGAGRTRGLLRQLESVQGLAILGLQEDNVIFLGYPDNYLHKMLADYRTTDSVLTTHHLLSSCFVKTY